jgi:diketogulonate reductase-like aldo/keto reductase
MFAKGTQLTVLLVLVTRPEIDTQIVEETLPALEELRREGLVRHIGITGLPLKIFRSVLDRCCTCDDSFTDVSARSS